MEYQLILPFIYPITYQIRNIMHQNNKPFYDIFINYLGYLLSGIVYLIIKYRSKNNYNDKETLFINQNNDCTEKKNTFTQIGEYNQKNKEKKVKGKYLYLLKLSLLYLVPMFIIAYAHKYINYKFLSNIYLFFIIFYYILFSRIILLLKIYSHQILSIIIILICIPILIIFYFINENIKDENLLFNSFLILITGALFSLYNILEKRYYNKYMDSPYHFMFFIGLISLCILIPYELFTIIFFGEDTNFNGILYQMKNNFKSYSFLYLLLLLADLLCSFFWIAGIHLIFYFLQPCHFIISESISQIISTFIAGHIKNYSIGNKISIYILYIIIVVSSLIYNEVIIINIGNLSTNTKKKIISRELLEKKILSDKMEKEFTDDFDEIENHEINSH